LALHRHQLARALPRTGTTEWFIYR